jgi:hypothetical protein
MTMQAGWRQAGMHDRIGKSGRYSWMARESCSQVSGRRQAGRERQAWQAKSWMHERQRGQSL